MSNEKIISKAICPCDKKVVTLEELVNLCHLVKKCVLANPEGKKLGKGIVSFSINRYAGLNLCIWEQMENNLECLSRIRTDEETLAGIYGLASFIKILKREE